MNLLDPREVDDLVELAVDLGRPHPEDRAVQIDVLAAGQVGVESRPDLQKRADAAVNPRVTRCRRRDARQYLEQRGLSRAVPTDDAEHLAALDLEGHVLQRPDGVLGVLVVHRTESGEPSETPEIA